MNFIKQSSQLGGEGGQKSPKICQRNLWATPCDIQKTPKLFGESMFNPYWENITCTARLVKREEGYFITGRGCGLSTPMKYLKDIPENLDDYKCSFIPIKTKVGFCSNDIEFKFINTPTGKFLAWWNLPIKSRAHGIV